MGRPLSHAQPPPAGDGGQSAALQVEAGQRQTDGADVVPRPHLALTFISTTLLPTVITHMSVQTEQGHVISWLRFKESVISQSENVSEVRMEEDLSGVISLDRVIFGEAEQVVLAKNNLEFQTRSELSDEECGNISP